MSSEPESRSPEAGHALLRIHLSNFLRHRGRPVYEEIVELARREGLAGATVLAGSSGYVGSGPLLGDHPAALAVERPVVVEIVELPETLDRFLDRLEPRLAGGEIMVTLERVRVAPESFRAT